MAKTVSIERPLGILGKIATGIGRILVSIFVPIVTFFVLRCKLAYRSSAGANGQ